YLVRRAGMRYRETSSARTSPFGESEDPRLQPGVSRFYWVVPSCAVRRRGATTSPAAKPPRGRRYVLDPTGRRAGPGDRSRIAKDSDRARPPGCEFRCRQRREGGSPTEPARPCVVAPCRT